MVLSGTKNTVDDLLAARDAGLLDRLRGFDGPVVGLCGGYQLLGERVTNAAVEGVGDDEVVDGAGLLPVETRFSPEKRVAAVEWELRGCGPLAGANATVSGYEIHAGETTLTGDADRPFPGVPDGAATDRVLGTYLHGLFENRVARDAFLDTVFARAGLERPTRGDSDAEIAETLEAHPLVEKVFYPGLKSHPKYDLACHQQKGFGSVFSVEFSPEVDVAQFLRGLGLFTPSRSLSGACGRPWSRCRARR